MTSKTKQSSRVDSAVMIPKHRNLSHKKMNKIQLFAINRADGLRTEPVQAIHPEKSHKEQAYVDLLGELKNNTNH